MVASNQLLLTHAAVLRRAHGDKKREIDDAEALRHALPIEQHRPAGFAAGKSDVVEVKVAMQQSAGRGGQATQSVRNLLTEPQGQFAKVGRDHFSIPVKKDAPSARQLFQLSRPISKRVEPPPR